MYILENAYPLSDTKNQRFSVFSKTTFPTSIGSWLLLGADQTLNFSTLFSGSIGG
jgi:hypothetical protein